MRLNISGTSNASQTLGSIRKEDEFAIRVTSRAIWGTSQAIAGEPNNARAGVGGHVTDSSTNIASPAARYRGIAASAVIASAASANDAACTAHQGTGSARIAVASRIAASAVIASATSASDSAGTTLQGTGSAGVAIASRIAASTVITCARCAFNGASARLQQADPAGKATTSRMAALGIRAGTDDTGHSVRIGNKHAVGAAGTRSEVDTSDISAAGIVDGTSEIHARCAACVGNQILATGAVRGDQVGGTEGMIATFILSTRGGVCANN